MSAHDSAIMNQVGTFRDANTQVSRLADGQAAMLRRAPQVIRVIKGQAWISLDAEDILVKSGQEIRLQRGKQAGVISSVNREPLVYEIR